MLDWLFGKDFTVEKEDTVHEKIIDIVDEAMNNIIQDENRGFVPNSRDVAIVEQFVNDLVPSTEEDDTILW